MGKILLWIVLIAVVVAWFRTRARQEAAEELRHAPSGPRQLAPESMVSCARCGLHLPASEAVFDAAHTAYCGAPHLEAARAARERR